MSVKHSFVALALIAAGCSAAAAVEYKGKATFTWVYAPQSLEGAPGQYFSVGQAIGKMVRENGPAEIRSMDETCNNMDLGDGTASAVCVAGVGAANHYWVSASCGLPLATPPAGALFACEGKATMLGGTGKFAAIKGGTTFTQVLTEMRADGTFAGYTLEEQDFSY